MTFEETYRNGQPPWDIGRPQSAIVELLDDRLVVAPVLDLGCGTGENALACAERGLEVRGIDGAPTAVAKARAKASERGLAARFDVGDALQLEGLDAMFQTVLDSGLFHVFDDADRPRYAASLRRVLRPGGRAFLLCFSDAEPNWGGPRRVSQAEIYAAFKGCLDVAEVRQAHFDTRDSHERVEAWRVRLERPVD